MIRKLLDLTLIGFRISKYWIVLDYMVRGWGRDDGHGVFCFSIGPLAVYWK